MDFKSFKEGIFMLLFFTGLTLLIFGYFTYGKFIEKQLAPDDRKTPAVELKDGIDFLSLPHWKNMLIQLTGQTLLIMLRLM